MASASRAQIPPREGVKPSNSLKTTYLILYNFVSAILWFAVLGRTVAVLGLTGRTEMVYKSTGEFTKWTQTLALVEVFHSLLGTMRKSTTALEYGPPVLIGMQPGIVRAPVLTTAMQVASRFLLVWAIVDQFPQSTSTSPAYASMLVAWSITEVIRYSYFVFFLTGRVPGAFAWLR